jgi:hypothetical protein
VRILGVQEEFCRSVKSPSVPFYKRGQLRLPSLTGVNVFFIGTVTVREKYYCPPPAGAGGDDGNGGEKIFLLSTAGGGRGWMIHLSLFAH